VIIYGKACFDETGRFRINPKLSKGFPFVIGRGDLLTFLPQIAYCQHGQGCYGHPCLMRMLVISRFWGEEPYLIRWIASER
jgi:hypothetical protein